MTVALSGTVGAALAMFAYAQLMTFNQPVPNPDCRNNPQFVAIGKAYLPQLGKAVRRGVGRRSEAARVRRRHFDRSRRGVETWSANRTKLFDQMLTPEFSKIVAESVNDADLTAAERSAMAAAWRGLSLGLRK